MSNQPNLPGSATDLSGLKNFPIVGRRSFRALAVCVLLAAASCNGDEPCDSEECQTCTITPDMSQSRVQELLIDAKCKAIRFSAGTFEFTSTLTIDNKLNFKVAGAGKGQTILSFANQSSGGDGLLVTNSTKFTIENLTVRDTKGDAIKVKDTFGVTFRGVETVWTAERSSANGGYGIYPVLCTDVLIENCYARGASDAGIYVGQTTNAIIRKSKAEKNVMGIQVENTINADVYENEVRDNAGGILAFDLQHLTQYGSKTRIFDNLVVDNNGDNFAVEGGFAAIAPAGTGILVMATRDTEIFDNTIDRNNVVGLGVISFISVSVLAKVPLDDPNYDPYFDRVYIHDNQFSKSDDLNTGSGQTAIGTLLINSFGGNAIPDIVVDGVFKPDTGDNGGLCLDNNTGAGFVNLDILNGFANPSFDATPHLCEGDVLDPVTLQ